MIRAFLKTKNGVALILALIIIIGGFAAKIAFAPKQQSDLSQKIALIADESVQKSLQNGSYEFENALNLLSGSSTASLDVENGTETPANSVVPFKTTATDRFARELFSKYVEAKNSGQSIDEVTQNDIAEMVLSNDYSGQRKLIATSELNISQDTSVQKARAYGNAIGAALAVPPVKGDQELIILEKIQARGITEADSRSLELIFARYKGIIDSLTAMSVPKDAGSAHAALLNGVYLLMDGVEGIMTLESDPVGALTKIKFYENGINLVSSGALKLKVYFMSKNITFSSMESGYNITQ